MDLQIRWTFEQHKHIAAEKEQYSRNQAMLEEARKDQNSQRVRHTR
jgi:hypothetical protein